jgi:hypothetical protein
MTTSQSYPHHKRKYRNHVPHPQLSSTSLAHIHVPVLIPIRSRFSPHHHPLRRKSHLIIIKRWLRRCILLTRSIRSHGSVRSYLLNLEVGVGRLPLLCRDRVRCPPHDHNTTADDKRVSSCYAAACTRHLG